MPSVPSYGGQRIGPGASPGNQVGTQSPLEAHGGGRSVDAGFRSAEQTADLANRIERKQKQDAYEIASQDILSKLSQKEAELTLRVKKSQKLGAQEEADAVLGDFDKFYGEIEKGLGDDRLRQTVKAHYDRHRTNLWSTGQGHAAGQMRVVDQDAFKAGMTSEMENGLSSVLDDPSLARTKQSFAARDAILTSYLKRNNEHPEVIEVARRQAASEMNIGVLETLLNNQQDIRAEEYYSVNKGGFTVDDQAKADRMLELGSRNGKAVRMVDDIRQNAPTRQEANRIISEISDHKLRKAVEERYDTVERRDEIAREADYQKDAANTFKMVSQRLVSGNSAEDVVGAPKWNRLNDRDKASLTKLYRQVNGLEEPANDWKVVTSFNLMSPAKRAALSEETLLKDYRPYMDDTTYAAATKAVKDAQDFKGEGLYSDEQNVFRAMQTAGVGGMSFKDSPETLREEKSGVKAALFGRFSTAVQQRYMAEESTKKAKLTPEEKQKILDSMLLKVRVNGFEEVVVYGTGDSPATAAEFKTGRMLYGQKAAFELAPDDRIPVGDIPTEEWDVILNHIQAAEAKNGWKFKDPKTIGEKMRAAYLSGNKAEWSRLLKDRD